MAENSRAAAAPTTDSPHRLIQESSGWHDAYDSDVQVKRRRAAIPPKLRRLGVFESRRDAQILDLCCGNGETLDALYNQGFRDLHGLDITISPDLAADPRFHVATGDATAPAFADGSFDWILIIHALHHLGPAERIQRLLQECYRILKPGGRLAIVDFPSSPQIRIAFWCFRRNFWLLTPYLRYFGRLIQEEWHFLEGYLSQWPQTRALLHNGIFEQDRFQQEIFYYYLTLRKPAAEAVE